MSIHSKKGAREQGGRGEKPAPFPPCPPAKKESQKYNPSLQTSPFIPWSLPGSVLLVFGVLMAYQGLPWLGMTLSSIALGMIALFIVPARVWLLLILLIPVGYLRFQVWQEQPNPLLPYFGQQAEFSGRTDGRILTLDHPQGVRVVISSPEPLHGHIKVVGELAMAQGKCNPGGFDYAAYLRRNNIWGQLFIKEVLEQKNLPANMTERLAQSVKTGLSAREAALAEAINLGIRNDLGDLRDIFAASGLAHILALSGLNVAVLVTVLGFVLKPLGLWRYPFLILLVFGFLSVVDQSPSVFRACVMASIVLFSLWRGAGRIDLWSTLGLSVILCLLWNPSWLFDISFQLSYLAVIGLMVFVGPISQKFVDKELPFWHWKKLLIESAIVSLAAQLATLPLIASAFGSVPVLSIFVNITAVPLATLIAPLGFAVMLIGLVSLPLAGVINQGMSWIYKGLIWQAELGSNLPNLIWGEISAFGYIFFYTGCFAFALMLWKYLKPYQALLVMLTAGLCSAVNIPQHPAPEIIFLDVGQGDSTLIRLPNRQEILINGGGTPFSDFDVGKRTVIPALKSLGIDELELVIATHADTDHIEGLVSVLDNFKVQTLVFGSSAEVPLFQTLIDTAKRNQVDIVQVSRGQSLSLGDARLDILNPPHKAFEEVNANSITFVLNYKNQPKALLMGDMPIDVESDLAFPDVDILMAGHHGSKSSTSEAMLRATTPKTVVVSYGRNTYGHPHKDLMARLNQSGATILETHHSGAIRLALE